MVEAVVADVVGLDLDSVVGSVVGGCVLVGAGPFELGVGLRYEVVGGVLVGAGRRLVLTVYLMPLTSVLGPVGRSSSPNVMANERAINGRKWAVTLRRRLCGQLFGKLAVCLAVRR